MTISVCSTCLDGWKFHMADPRDKVDWVTCPCCELLILQKRNGDCQTCGCSKKDKYIADRVRERADKFICYCSWPQRDLLGYPTGYPTNEHDCNKCFCTKVIKDSENEDFLREGTLGY